MVVLKRCVQCQRRKSLTEFYRFRRAPDGLQYRCKPCGKEQQRMRARRLGIPEKRRRDPRHLTQGKKECFKCDRVKMLSEFSPTVRGVGCRAAYCRPCTSRLRSAHPMHRTNVYLWRAKNRARYLAQHSAHQQRRRASVVDSTVTSTFLCALYSERCCFYCRRRTCRAQRTADHKTPLSRGGVHSARNLVMACGSCNSKKSDMTVREFQAKQRQQERKK